MTLHFNPGCTDGQTATAKLREEFGNKCYGAAVLEAAKLQSQNLPPEEALVADVYRALCRFNLGNATADKVNAMFPDFIARALRMQNDELVASLRGIRIQHLHRQLRPELVARLISRRYFFDGISLAPHTQAHHRIAFASLQTDPVLALGYLQDALQDTSQATHPCLYETIARYMAGLMVDAGQPDTAESLLASAGVDTRGSETSLSTVVFHL